jgi:hypothetical protein
MALLEAPVQKGLDNIVSLLSHFLADLTVINEDMGSSPSGGNAHFLH